MSHVESYRRRESVITYKGKYLHTVRRGQSFWVSNEENTEGLYLVYIGAVRNGRHYHEKDTKLQPFAVTMLPQGDKLKAIILEPSIQVNFAKFKFPEENLRFPVKCQDAKDKQMIASLKRMHSIISSVSDANANPAEIMDSKMEANSSEDEQMDSGTKMYGLLLYA